MKRLAGVLSVVAVVAASSIASAGEFRGPLFSAPGVVSFDGEAAMKPVPEAGTKVELFECVKYRDLNHISPCAEPKVVEVLDPCWKPDPCNPCCKPKCVKVLICVPKEQTCCAPAPSCCAPAAPSCAAPAPTCCQKAAPCGCKSHGPKITCTKDGKHTRYDYGKYAVDVRVKDGWIDVDYDD